MHPLIEVLELVDSGKEEVRYTGTNPEADVFSGNVPFESASGWRIVVFIDCGDWDYVDRAISPSGEEYDFDDLPDWRPEHPEFWKIKED